MNIRLATLEDVLPLAALEQSQLQDELSIEQRNSSLDGQSFSQADLTCLVTQHWVVVAELGGHIVGYVIAGRWAFFKQWPIYRNLLNRLSRIEYDKARLTEKNCCQYGPIWIATDYRGQGIFEALVKFVRKAVSKELPYMLTFIAEDNGASFAAHTRKGGMQVVDFISFDERDYYLLVLPTTESFF
ncbi:GNAT family N-acetyltransferase [Shewanella sp. Choline-02u-19]|uniref:GNAT family N-acetyltransferase n=1 Tax=unclassified Shewanella TaxID=196818 RepID=UPI000C334B3D|nr:MULTISPECIES: GNAT family N-acetyltransferase [unclassified Shewanella]PKH56280.1 GNAT family N-acetyltransferase [Shewanella sp. Bg11-22]PKI30074.1 GNAT family N-acetyltransferase [Shewanella sp. Choline-02u-19]